MDSADDKTISKVMVAAQETFAQITLDITSAKERLGELNSGKKGKAGTTQPQHYIKEVLGIAMLFAQHPIANI